MHASSYLDTWIKKYEADANAAIVELCNFLIAAAGLDKVHLDLSSVAADGEEEPLEELLTDTCCQQLVDEAFEQLSYIEPYPLADKKNGKKFKLGLLRLVENLLGKVQHEILYDQVFLPWLIEWASIMTTMKHRGVRHTGTEVGMIVLLRLSDMLVTLAKNANDKERQGGGKKKKKDAMSALLQNQLVVIADKKSFLQEEAHKIVEVIFMGRYRDSCDEIRVSCADEFGKVV
jgi:hypothetical protein